MNKKGFTLIELIAVVVIMAIIALIATPNIVNMLDKGKKEDYVADAKEIIAKATYMYKQEKYKKEYFSNGEISLKDIKKVKDFTDPYGFEYDKDHSKVKFEESAGAVLKERQVKITLISYNENKTQCYTIDSTYDNDLTVDKVKSGTYNGTGCSIENNS